MYIYTKSLNGTPVFRAPHLSIFSHKFFWCYIHISLFDIKNPSPPFPVEGQA